MPGRHDDEILAAAAAHARPAVPAVIVCVNLHNFKPFNVVLGHQRGDRLLERVQQRLADIGRAWRTGGDEFVALAAGTLDAVTERVRALSWLLHATVGATEAWTFRFADGRPSHTVPWRSFSVVCTPRCGLAELGPDPAASLELARRRAGELRRADPGKLPRGFAPLAARPWTGEVRLAAPVCPACGHDQPDVADADLGWSRERCPACDASYERVNVLAVLGDEFEAGYM